MRAGATHCPPSSSSSPSRSPSPHPPSATASPSSSPHPSRPLPHLHLHSCPRTRTLTLTSLHCARADVGCSARVWARLVRSATPLCRVPIGRGCSAREGVIWSAGLVAPRCWQRYSGRPPGRRSPPALAGGSRLTPGGGQAIPRARLPLGVRCGPRHHRSPAAPPSRGVV